MNIDSNRIHLSSCQVQAAPLITWRQSAIAMTFPTFFAVWGHARELKGFLVSQKPVNWIISGTSWLNQWKRSYCVVIKKVFSCNFAASNLESDFLFSTSKNLQLTQSCARNQHLNSFWLIGRENVEEGETDDDGGGDNWAGSKPLDGSASASSLQPSVPRIIL